MFEKANDKLNGGLTLLIIPMAVVLVIFAAIITYSVLNVSGFKKQDAKEIVTASIGNLLTEPTVAPTPFPFQELTIPNLRMRVYSSELGELDRPIEKSNFTSYITSYDSDGFQVYGYLTVPNGEMPENGWPAVVFVHGYIPPAEYRTEQNYVSYADALADNGLVVFKIDLRGHGASQGIAYGAYYSETYVVDVLNAYSALQSADFVDPKRIGLWGHSMAGNVVFRALVARPEIRNVVIWAGAVYTYEDFSNYRISDNSYRPPPQESERTKYRERLFDTYGDFDPESEFWKQIPGTNYLTGITSRVQLHHAVDDNVVDIEYSRNLMKVLDGTDFEHELFEYSSGGHNLIGSSFTTAMSRSANFLKN